jgi:predicted protein tyrosine phosphatase
MKIIVSSLALARSLIVAERPSHVVSLLSPEEIHLAPDGHDPARHLRLAMHDLGDGPHDQDAVPPAAAHVAELLAFGGDWDARESILIHCWAGISRSTAAAFTLACARNPHVEEVEIAAVLRAASPTAFPNPRIVAYADAALGRQGRMIEAIRAIGRPDEFDGVAPFHLPAVFTVKKG